MSDFSCGQQGSKNASTAVNTMTLATIAATAIGENAMLTDLKPCPFCGGDPDFDHDDDGWNWIVCQRCGATTNASASLMDDCKPLLAERWNSRAIAAERDAMQAKVAEQSAEISELRNRLSQKMDDCVKAERKQESDAEKYWQAREMLVARTQQQAERIAELEVEVECEERRFGDAHEMIAKQAALIEKCKSALKYHTNMTRPLNYTDNVLAEIEAFNQKGN